MSDEPPHLILIWFIRSIYQRLYAGIFAVRLSTRKTASKKRKNGYKLYAKMLI